MTDKRTIDNLVAFLERITDEELTRYAIACRATSEHNDSNGVGVRFDYAPYPALPKWFEEAKALIAQVFDERLCFLRPAAGHCRDPDAGQETL